ncbi:metallophosphoesterase [Kovacikia minuta CCNUW1]|uniref:metallophosphoesterase family protein n=1 Tax=Kovacikia minuta TaxID=2931930 RepID=UPI001CCB516F|nr:metallophosphoesterase [Kovacikia minuta]UBF23758.1 metallophosphoesterase [Kovacikia minuta CCNUW1]
MQFVSDPSIASKITKMKQRVLWRDPLMQQRDIDQTRLVLDDGQADSPEFSFLVLGDSGSGPHRGHNPQRRIAERMLPHRDECRFILHTGDVVYLVGSSDYYLKNFIEPYREFLVGGERYKSIPYDRMVFNLPFLPVPGNHDYYDLPFLYGILAQATLPIRRLLESRIDLDVGWRGSGQGNVYARAFLDYLKALGNAAEVDAHLARHYTIRTSTGYCLRYQPGHFTRLPNRYYTFRVGGIDFFALDSNTFNAPEPPPPTPSGDQYRRQLEVQRMDMEKQILEILEASANLDPNKPEEAEQLDDLHAKLEQLEEVKQDIDKQLSPPKGPAIDLEQLEWLQQRLIESWHTKSVRGRVLFFHHPPYVTEATKWHQAQTLTVRRNLRRALDPVADAVSELAQGRPVVDLVLNGHAHCLEYLRTVDTGHADANTNWIVCGGSGYSLRRQRMEGTELQESFEGMARGDRRTVAKSHLYVGRSGQGSQKRRPYSCLRIDVKDGSPPKFVVRPILAEYSQRQWRDYDLDHFEI